MIPVELKRMLSQAYMIYVKPYQFIGLIVIISLIIGYISVLALGDDNPIEKTAETLLRKRQG